MRKPAILSSKKVASLLKQHPAWSLNSAETKLTRIATFETHIEAAVFIIRSTVHAEVLQHHPDITFTHCKVKIVTTTHDSGGITRLDEALIKRLDDLLDGG